MTQPDDVIVVTSNDVPGHRIVVVFGEVFGLVVRARDYFSNIGARFRTVVGGEVVGYTQLLSQTRDDALARLRARAAELGANAVVAARFDTSEIGGIMNEVAAYGTAVYIEPMFDGTTVAVRVDSNRAAQRIKHVAKPGQRMCANQKCEARGLPTPLSTCDLCSRPTIVVPAT